MPVGNDSNVHDPKFREAKPPQAGSDVAIADVFRLDGRSILIKSHCLTVSDRHDMLISTVTGGCGDLGTTTPKAALESGADVICLDLVPTPPSDVWGEQSRSRLLNI
jgi:hypothetical protein